MKIKMVNGKIAVGKTTKTKKLDELGFAKTEVIDGCGEIQLVFEGSHFIVGQKVYFGNKREALRMAGNEYQIMDEDNIFAIVEEDGETPTQ